MRHSGIWGRGASLLTAAALLAALGAAPARAADAPANAPADTSDAALAVRTVALEPGRLPLELKTIGTIATLRRQAAVERALSDGVVTTLTVQQGDRVSSGAVLVQLDPRAAEAALSQARSQRQLAARELSFARGSDLDQQQASLDLEASKTAADAQQARQEADRQKSLLAQGLTSRKAADQAEQAASQAEQAAAAARKAAATFRSQGRAMALDRLEGALRDADATLAQARLALERTTVRAPLAGTVSRVPVTEGQVVTAGDPLVELEPEAGVGVRFALTPDQADQVAPGATFSLGPKGAYHGRVLSVGRAVSDATGLVPVEGRLDDGSSRPYLGQALAGAIVVGQSLGGFVVPEAALTMDGDQAQVALVGPDGTARQTAVDVVTRVGGRAVISGADLHAGQQVIVDGNYNLEDGTAVAAEATTATAAAPASGVTP